MPSLIKANAAMLSGNPQLAAYNVATASDGGLSINAEFVVLSQFAFSVYSSFKIGSDLHPSLKAKTDIIAALQNYNSPALPTLTSVDIVTASGLSTISVQYSGEAIDTAGTNPDGSPKVAKETSTSLDLRSLSGVALLNGQTFAFSFDYYATTVTVEVIDGGSERVTAPNPSAPFNVRSKLSPSRFLSVSQIRGARTYRNNLGQTKTSTSATGVWIQSSGFAN